MSLVIRVLLIAVCLSAALAQSYSDDELMTEKRAMRNALVRFGRASSGARNALVRFGKRSEQPEFDSSAFQGKRTGPPQPFVRFGRSGQIDHMHDILDTLRKLELANLK